MEDILASIKRIIAEDGEPVARKQTALPASENSSFRPLGERVDEDDEMGGILELTQPIDSCPSQPESSPLPQQPEGQAEPESEVTSAMPHPYQEERKSPPTTSPASSSDAAAAKPIMSENTATASRHSLAALSAMIVKPEEAGENTLEGLVREMLRPMLKDWLDDRLPALVERLVEQEIRRITGRAF